nr:MAG TPA: hypothetical protein [Caudoviricetes sp.]
MIKSSIDSRLSCISFGLSSNSGSSSNGEDSGMSSMRCSISASDL